MSWPWSELGLSGPSDVEAIKHAYAQRLKEVHPEEDPEGFQRLQRAYQMARRLARLSGPGNGPAPAWTAPETPESAPETAPPEPEAPGADRPEADPSGTDAPKTEMPQWDFETLLSQGEAETEPEDEIPEEETAWVPPVYTSRGTERRPRRRIRISQEKSVAILLVAAFLVVIALNWPIWFPSTAARAAETQEWLEQAFDVELVSSPHNRDREEDRFLYWLEEDPDVCFQAIWDEEGDYRTNYTNALLFQELKAFSQEWPENPLWFDRAMTDSAGAGAEGGAPPSEFFFQIPLEGAEDFLDALGTRLEQLAEDAEWYRRQPPEFQIFLMHGETDLYTFHSTEGEVPTREQLLEFYQEKIVGVLLQDLLFEQDVVLWDYPDEENLIWANTGAGWVQEESGWWISCRGTGRSGEDLTMHYFLRGDYTALYCIPGQVLNNPEEMFTLSCTDTLTMPCGRTVDIYRQL